MKLFIYFISGSGWICFVFSFVSNTLPVWAKAQTLIIIIKTTIHHQNANSQQISQNIEEQTAGKLFLKTFIHSLSDKDTQASWASSFLYNISIDTQNDTKIKPENTIIDCKIVD